MEDEIINDNIIEGGSPIGDPSEKDNSNIKENEENTKEDELTKKIKEVLAEQFKDISSQYTSAISELKNNSELLEKEKYKMEVEKLLGDSEILDGRFFDFIYSDDIELVKTRIENLENLIIEKVKEMAQKEVDIRLGQASWIPGDNSNIEGIDTFKKPSYMV